MTQHKDIIETVHDIKKHYNQALDASDWGDWEKTFNLTWERQREISLEEVVPALFRLVVAPNIEAHEWRGPDFIIDQAEGYARQKLTLRQLEVRSRSQLAPKTMGGILYKSWHFKSSLSPYPAPQMIGRELTQQERDAHAIYGGSQTAKVVTHLAPPIDLILGYDQDWFIRDGSNSGERFDTTSQIGGVVIRSLEQSVKQLLPLNEQDALYFC